MRLAVRRTSTVFLVSAAVILAPLTIAPAPPAAAAVTVTDWAALQAAFEAGGTETVVLAADITGPITEGLALEAGDDVILDLNGYELQLGNPDFREGAYGAGIGVPFGAALTIRDSEGNLGHLRAYGGDSSAGIGGSWLLPDQRSGTITIEGGQVTAFGGRLGAGIGSGLQARPGAVIITGGIVVARGGQASAGIGGGQQNPAGGSVLITGGVVTATGNNSSAGIGGGNTRGAGVNTTITGGVVTARGGTYGAGIGGGRRGHGAAVVISGGQVDAEGGIYASAIGSGGSDEWGQYSDKPGTLHFIGTSAGTVPASGANGRPWVSTQSGAGAVVSVEPGPTTFTAKDVSASAAHLIVTFTPRVVFETLGGTPTPSPVSVDAEGRVAEPDAPTRPGGAFLGWSTGHAGGPFWDFVNGTTTKDLTLVASWERGTPAATSAPAITGAALLGSTLTVSSGTWDFPGLSYSYQWYRGSTAIVGAEAPSYTVAEADLGQTLKVEVTARVPGDLRYLPGTASSAPFTVPPGTLALDGASITGTRMALETLTASITTTPAGTVAYQWLRDGVPISGATSASYLLSPEDAGTEVSARLTVSRAGYHDLEHTVDAGSIAYRDVVVSVAPRIAGTAETGSTLAVEHTTDPAGTVAYQWLRDGAAIAGATSASYVVTSADVDRAVSVRVTVSEPGYRDYVATSTPVTAELGSISVSVAPRITGTAETGSTLTVEHATDPAGTAVYQWLRDGTPITGATSPSYLVTSADVGHEVSVRVTVSEPGYHDYVATSDPVAVESASISVSVAPRITGTAETGSTLTVEHATDPAGTAVYQWLRDGTPIAGATSSSYLVTSADVGHEVSVRVTVSEPGYHDYVATSDPVTVVRATIDLVAAPSITGTARVAHTVVASITTDPAGSVAYQWLRDGTPIAGSTGATHLLTVADAEHEVSVQVTVSAPGYDDLVSTSDAVTVDRGLVGITVPAAVSGVRQVGNALAAGVTTDPSGSHTYQWLRDGIPIPGATASSYVLTAADADRAVSAQITVSASGYHDLVVTAPAGTIEPGIIGVVELPEITGTPGVAHELRVSLGDWSPVPDALAYAWLRDGVPIVGAESAVYTPTLDDDGVELSVAVTVSAVGHHDRTMTVGPVLVDAEPGFVPDPVDAATLSESARGDVEASVSGRTATLTVPVGLHDRWLYLYGHSTPVGLGWFRTADGSMVIDVSLLPAGEHSLAVLGLDGSLLGWAPVTIAALPATGPDRVHLVLLLGVALLAAGALVVLPRTMRRIAPHRA